MAKLLDLCDCPESTGKLREAADCSGIECNGSFEERSSPLLFEVSGERRSGGVSERPVGPPGVVVIDPCRNFLMGKLAFRRSQRRATALPGLRGAGEGT